MQFNKTYFILFIALLLMEVAIALYVPGGFVRHTFGDVLVVILIYCCLKSLFPISPKKAAFYVLIFAFTIEFLQLTTLLELLHLNNNRLARTVLGTTFSISDLVAYAIGILLVLFFEHKFSKKGINI